MPDVADEPAPAPAYVHADLLPGVVASTVGYASVESEERLHRGVPSPWLTVILSLDGPIAWSEDLDGIGTGAERRESVLVSALHTRATAVRLPRRQAGLQLAVHPLEARRLLGASPAELASRGVTGPDVLGAPAEALRQRLVETASWPERFALLQTFLRGRLESAPRSTLVRPELAEAWRWLLRSDGRRRLDGLATHVALSPRHLTTLFAREVGLPPKRVARLVRFDATARSLTRATAAGRRTDLAALAAARGYADQSHLDREFRDHLGTSPTAWLAEEHRNIQAGGHRNGEG
ncbi:helix-turn-helix domain-containing protein [Microlunatus flavus]|uniref:AraC-type DNA-binding protein n=1 Tax=Microlunatus flavus TaxID=1036181 RepID=A0A1H9ASH9_9ACTN|nr:helix-turn-helix domain-containing protein [Microlunatus flavus]SEP79670.1 AraC-type DNA-binding protein [Microlunatus flavus]